MSRRKNELAVMESLDSGKTIYDCETVDVPETIHCLKWHAELIDKIYDQVSPASDDHIAMVVREPIGVVVAISAFNHPLNLIVHQVGPALAAGCPVIIKPAPDTPLSCMRFIRILRAAGLPDAWAQALLTRDDDTASRLVTDERVAFFSFIGLLISIFTLAYVAVPALIVENLGPVQAIGRSISMVRHRFWPTFWTGFLAAIIIISRTGSAIVVDIGNMK